MEPRKNKESKLKDMKVTQAL